MTDPNSYHLSPEIQVEDRQLLLERFSAEPTDEALWQTAYNWVVAEGDTDNTNGIASDIPTIELIDLAKKVRNTPQPQRYDVMTELASNGEHWFDVLETFSSGAQTLTKKEIISAWVHQTDPPIKFQKVLDLGTGTGKTLDALEGSAEKVVGIDRNAALLSVAKQKVNVGTELVQGEVNQLPFEDGTFDLATSSGLTGSLDRETLSGFYKELARALKPNGIYVEVAPWPFDDYVDEQDTRITASSKAMLADMIVDTVSGKHQIVDHLEPVEQMDLFKSLDLGIKHYDVPSKDGKTRSLLTVMTKIN